MRRRAVPVLVCFVHTTRGPQSANIGQVRLTWAAGATRRMAASVRPPDITSATALCFPSIHLSLFQHPLRPRNTIANNFHHQHRRHRGTRRFATAIQQRPNPPRAQTDCRALEIRVKAGFPAGGYTFRERSDTPRKVGRPFSAAQNARVQLARRGNNHPPLLGDFSDKRHIATMLSSSLLCIASALLASAHTVITYPGWRGNNLITDEDFPYGMQWMYPCKSPLRRRPRTLTNNLLQAAASP